MLLDEPEREILRWLVEHLYAREDAAQITWLVAVFACAIGAVIGEETAALLIVKRGAKRQLVRHRHVDGAVIGIVIEAGIRGFGESGDPVRHRWRRVDEDRAAAGILTLIGALRPRAALPRHEDRRTDRGC